MPASPEQPPLDLHHRVGDQRERRHGRLAGNLDGKIQFCVAGETRTREMAAYEGGPAAAEVKSAESIATQHATWFMDRDRSRLAVNVWRMSSLVTAWGTPAEAMPPSRCHCLLTSVTLQSGSSALAMMVVPLRSVRWLRSMEPASSIFRSGSCWLPLRPSGRRTVTVAHPGPLGMRHWQHRCRCGAHDPIRRRFSMSVPPAGGSQMWRMRNVWTNAS